MIKGEGCLAEAPQGCLPKRLKRELVGYELAAVDIERLQAEYAAESNAR